MTLTGKLDSSVYNQAEFKKAKTPERIRMYLITGEEISAYKLRNNELEYLKLMRRAWCLMEDNRRRPHEAVKLLRTQMDLTRYRGAQVMRDACNLFGSFDEVHRPTQRAMIREGLMNDIEWIESEISTADDSNTRMAWMKVKQGFWKGLVELDNVSKQEDAVARDTTLPMIEFTTDEDALIEAATEDIDYEDA